MSEDPKLSTAQKRALLDRNISSRTVARKAEQSLADDKEHRVYRNWANWILKGAGIDVVMQDFTTDLADGVVLNRMVEAFSGRTQRYTKVCANEFQKIDNINLALAWFKRKGLTTTVASQDFVNGNLRPILGFFWMLIQKYQLVSNQSMSFTPIDETGTIYDWVSKYVKDYPGMGDVKLSSPQDFRDGKVLNYMVHKNVPEVIPLDQLDRETPETRLERAIGEAYDKLGVPLLMEPRDLLDANPHEPTLLTYLFAFKATVENEKHLAKRKEQMEESERERRALLGKAQQADQLAAEAARQKAELERERQRLQEEEARRREEERARRAAEEAERERMDKERDAELNRLRKAQFDMLQSQRAADADRAAKDAEAERLRKELEELRRMQAERDKALKDLAELEAQRRRDEEARLAAERAKADAERARAQAESNDADAKRRWAEMQKELDDARRKAAEEARMRQELEDARRRAEAEAERLRREAEDARRQREAEERARAEAERRARQAAEDADARDRAMRDQLEMLKSQATPSEMGMDCAGCRLKLSGLVVRVNGSTLYHENCFVCKTCSCTFEQFYFPHRNVPYCQRHYVEAAGLKCAKCHEFVTDDKVVVARGAKYHSRCFVCSDPSCGRPFEDSFYMRSNQPYCARHFGGQGN